MTLLLFLTLSFAFRSDTKVATGISCLLLLSFVPLLQVPGFHLLPHCLLTTEQQRFQNVSHSWRPESQLFLPTPLKCSFSLSLSPCVTAAHMDEPRAAQIGNSCVLVQQEMMTGALLSPQQRTKHCSSSPVMSLPWGVPSVGSRQDLALCSESALQESAWKK